MIRLIVLVVAAFLLYVWIRPSRWASVRQWLVPAVVVFLALLYLPAPIDLIPDVGPIGFLDDLVILASAIWWARNQLGARRDRPASERRDSTGPAGSPAGDWDPYEVLGVQPDASATEITRAYRTQLKRYHPDRVADLGVDLQKLAHQKTLEIQRAYEELRSA